jgi:outer membrane murein-binding lipoprotein Lpp
MRVARLILIMMACFSALFLAGCSSGENSDASSKIEELTKQVEALNKAIVINASSKIEELTKQVEALNKAIVINADGIGRFATPTPVPLTDYNQYGFGLPVPSNLEIGVTGLTGPDASKDNGSLLATAGGISLFLVWSTVDPPLTPAESVIGGFQMLQELTGVAFEAQGAGEGLTVDSQPGSYATFMTRDAQDEIEGVGIIGGWICPNDERSYAITVTGRDLEPVQQSFVYLTNGFRCESGSTQTPTPTATPES